LVEPQGQDALGTDLPGAGAVFFNLGMSGAIGQFFLRAASTGRLKSEPRRHMAARVFLVGAAAAICRELIWVQFLRFQRCCARFENPSVSPMFRALR